MPGTGLNAAVLKMWCLDRHPAINWEFVRNSNDLAPPKTQGIGRSGEWVQTPGFSQALQMILRFENPWFKALAGSSPAILSIEP